MKAIFLILIVSIMLSCSNDRNVFYKTTPMSDKERARVLLQEQRYDEAIEKLQKFLSRHPKDYEARSILANILLKKAGISEFDILERLLDQSSDQSFFEQLTSGMPEATDENINNLRDALKNLNEIPDDLLTDEQKYQKAIMQASLASMILKKSATNESGEFTNESVQNLTDEEAEEIYNSLTQSENNLQSTTGDSDDAQALSSVISDIDSQTGDSTKQKLTKFLVS
jgi:tetratricopeptide (TPR) repeat protein